MKTHSESCATVPDFTRLKYFYGQMLGAQDFQKEQDYFREKLKLHNRCLHGYGTVCGLMVVPEPVDPSCESDTTRKRDEIQRELDRVNQQIKEKSSRDEQEMKSLESQMQEMKAQMDKLPPHSTEWANLRDDLDQLKLRMTEEREDEDYEIKELRERAERLARELEELPKEHAEEEMRTSVEIECGLALDCQGNELVVRQPWKIDLLHALRLDPDYDGKTEGAHTLYVSICYCEQPVDPVRPVLPDACGASSACTYGKVRDSVRVRVSLEPPQHDERCETCCESCADACLLLARIDDFIPGHPLSPHQIHNEVRRPVGLYTSTTITGINWTQGAEYTRRETAHLLGTEDAHGGLVIRFSKPVLVSTLKKGVIDLWVVRGGEGEAGSSFYMEGKFMDLPANSATTDTIRYRQTTGEVLNTGDRLIIVVRASFILDHCCRPVNGMHVGGRVPLLPDYHERFYRGAHFAECEKAPPGYGPWATVGPGSFESWIYVKRGTKYIEEEL
ncbi:MAG TPA: hypothetical protein VK619_00075 [Pyrinomonadaceae bacterium]|nr:hypothetical protein [Pyrinomonadaceae bacterium]